MVFLGIVAVCMMMYKKDGDDEEEYEVEEEKFESLKRPLILINKFI